MWEDLLESSLSPGTRPTDGRHFLIVTAQLMLIKNSSWTQVTKTTHFHSSVKLITNTLVTSDHHVSAPVAVHPRSIDSVIWEWEGAEETK